MLQQKSQLEGLEDEQVRKLFSQACIDDDIDTAGFLFSKYLDKKNTFTSFVFEQGVMIATKNGSPCVTKYLLDKSNFNNSFTLPSFQYSVVIENQDISPNLEVLEALCVYLEDKEELIRIKDDSNFKNKEFFDFYLNARFERENLEMVLPGQLVEHGNYAHKSMKI